MKSFDGGSDSSARISPSVLCIKAENVVIKKENKCEEECTESKCIIEALKTEDQFETKIKVEDSCVKQEESIYDEDCIESKFIIKTLKTEDQFEIKTDIKLVEKSSPSETVGRSHISRKPKHKDSSDVQMHKCDTCSYQTRQKSHLKSHQMTHKPVSEIPTHNCLYCDFETKHKNSLKEHIISIHRGVLLDPEENMKIKHALKLRKALTAKMYKCDKCRYETVDKSNLNAHQLLHKDLSELQMYKCDKCSYDTKYRRDLKKHELTHKDSSQVQMYRCDKCNFETKYKGNMKTHQSRRDCIRNASNIIPPANFEFVKCD